MKKIGIISDIHGNLHSFESVISALGKEGVDEVWCLGDIVGYGAFPRECIELAKETCSIILGGNHDLAVASKISLSEFNYEAREAVEWTVEQLEESEIKFLGELEPIKKISVLNFTVLLSHGSPVNPVWEYVFTGADAARAFYAMEAEGVSICFLGHSHVQMVAAERNGEVAIERPEKFSIEKNKMVILNPGSVGQPRDYDPRAAYIVLHNDYQIEFRRVEYDVDAAAKAIVEAGLPPFLAARLKTGY